MSELDLKETLALAESLAQQAGEITLRYYGGQVDFERKGDLTPVTIADREAEEHIRAQIRAQFPNHGLLGEERGAENPGAEYQWIIDPIDGTKSFIRGVPFYGVLIALERNQESRVGVIHLPALEQTIGAAVGCGAWMNGEPIRVADAASRAETLFCTTSPAFLWNVRPDFCAESFKRFPLQRGWGDCYGYALVAMGRAQAMLDPEMSIWDTAAVKPIIEEAGGVFTDLDGNPTAHGGHCLAATPTVHAEILQMLRDYPAAAGSSHCRPVPW
ncbi:MAG: inositol monophosphatase family protein [Betaproteobacteria bacterium]|nr:inositol monophosphatase family protein [Betaproteobacteria bacterium]MDH3436924.1 inositol monophosphatase family protein [Betaproteobacteria bacterium]